MTGLCGWLGASIAANPPEQAMHAMAEGLAQAGEGPGAAKLGATGGLHVQLRGAAAGLHTEGTLWTGIEGYPRWVSQDLAELARAKGHAAALAEAYRRHGTGLFKHLTGPFSIAVIELDANRALIAIDRFAVHTMSWANPPSGGLVFGATTQAVRAHPAVTSTVTPQAIFDFLFCYVSPAPKTIYREQHKLLPAQYLLYENGRTSTETYWRMPYGDGSEKGIDELEVELHRLFEQATRRTLKQEDTGRVGAFLSGGLDSSTIAGYLGRVTGQRPKTFTVVFEQGSYDESFYAEIVARRFDAERYEYKLTPKDALDLIPKVAQIYDEPFGNSSAIPAYYCAKAARDRNIDVLLAGDGGDELFGGNERYVSHKLLGLYGRLPALCRERIVEPLSFSLAPLGRPFRRAGNAIRYARMPLPERLEYYNFWYSTDYSKVLEPEFLAAIDTGEPIELRRQIYTSAAADDQLQRLMHLDLTVALADNDLRKVNKMCELAGARVRYPFLDEDLAEFAARVPPRLLIKGHRLRYFYKKAMRDFLPPETLSKRKHGFGMPFEEWVKQDPGLRALARDALVAFKARGYFKAEFLDGIVDAHARQTRSSFDTIVWDIVMLELWLKAHESSEPSRSRP